MADGTAWIAALKEQALPAPDWGFDHEAAARALQRLQTAEGRALARPDVVLAIPDLGGTEAIVQSGLELSEGLIPR
tara:strand:- start:89 stop:316 length:228 start_codon:yes stop_codon:yes gene_type:complete